MFPVNIEAGIAARSDDCQVASTGAGNKECTEIVAQIGTIEAVADTPLIELWTKFHLSIPFHVGAERLCLLVPFHQTLERLAGLPARPLHRSHRNVEQRPQTDSHSAS